MWDAWETGEKNWQGNLEEHSPIQETQSCWIASGNPTGKGLSESPVRKSGIRTQTEELGCQDAEPVIAAFKQMPLLHCTSAREHIHW